MLPVSFSIDAPPPTRADPGRCADRWSPNALPLFRAAVEHVAASPDDFPLREEVGVVVVSSKPLPDGDGYGALDPMIAVLVDAGLLADERLVTWERPEVAASVSGYSIRIQRQRG